MSTPTPPTGPDVGDEVHCGLCPHDRADHDSGGGCKSCTCTAPGPAADPGGDQADGDGGEER